MKHLIISDMQVKPKHDYSWIRSIGNYAVETKPDVIVCIGDFADMSSLSSYDVGKKSFEGRRYKDDLMASYIAMDHLMKPIRKEQWRIVNNKKKQWNPILILTLGNHEYRINKCVESDPKLEGVMSTEDLAYASFGWDVVDFLQPIEIDGINYCHYFVSGVMGRAFTSADRMVKTLHSSCVMGHVQNADISITQRDAKGRPLLGLFSGLSTVYEEEYLSPQTNASLRQIWELGSIKGGFAIPRAITIEKLIKEYL